jgi:sugar/nucleoside kinase (ribokinase family)
MTLSDSFCVDRYRDEFLELMRSGTVDIVLANDHEIKALYQTASFDTALEALRRDCRLAAVTRSEQGSVIVRGDETVKIDAIAIRELVDTTGAGDLYAAGFLFGYTQGRSLEDSGRLGSLAAGLVIQQVGPRPRQNLRTGGVDLDRHASIRTHKGRSELLMEHRNSRKPGSGFLSDAPISFQARWSACARHRQFR